MGSHFRVNPTTPVTFTFTLPPPSVTKIGPSWWNRLRKHPFVDSIIKRMVSETVKELVDRAQDWARDFVPQLFGSAVRRRSAGINLAGPGPPDRRPRRASA